MDSDEQKIRNVIDLWQTAAHNGDLEQLASLMSEDVVFLLSGQPPIRGREGFAAGLQAALERVSIESKAEVQEIRVAGDFAYCWNRLEVTMTPRDGGAPKVRAGDTLTIFRKQPDGTWQLVRDANLLS